MVGQDDPLNDLQHKIDLAKGGQAPPDDAPGEGLGKAMRLGVELVAGVLVGGGLGFFIDRWLGTLPLFFIICFFLGAAAGFRNMMRG